MLPDEITTYLAGAGLGLTAGVNLFEFPFPTGAQDSAACVIETSAEEAEDTFGPSLAPEAVTKPHFQIVVRDADAQAARQLARSITLALRNLQAVLSGVRYLQVKLLSGPFFLKFDENRRAHYVSNFRAFKEES